MANYDYNGVELPALPEWDKTEYPYAIISISDTSTTLTVSAQPSEGAPNNDATINTPTPLLFSHLLDGVWGDFATAPFDYMSTSASDVKWANHDIYFYGGALFLAASEPVPAGYGIISLAHYKASCDNIRAKTGKTALIKSGDMPVEINLASRIMFQKLVSRTLETISAEDLEGIEEIKPHAFNGSSLLTSVELPEGLRYIQMSAFASCANIESIVFPRSLYYLGQFAFNNCVKLKEVTFLGVPNSIGDNVFAASSNLTTINVPWAEGEIPGAPWGATNANVNYNYKPSYLSFKSSDKFSISTRNSTKNWDGTLYYSTDTENWKEWNGTTIISSARHLGEQSIYIRGTGNTTITGSTSKYWSLIAVEDVHCYGNIENLLDFEEVSNGEHPEMGDYCYTALFSSWHNLVTAPELPATTLTKSCYNYMFNDCGRLLNAPKLPATTAAYACYLGMFEYCSSLTSAPELPATTLEKSCYYNMFFGCSSLLTAPELPATTLPNYCYSGMFNSCTNLTTLPKLSATTYGEDCCSEMFLYCKNIKLSETQTGEYQTAYSIPSAGVEAISYHNDSLEKMFTTTGGTFTGTPEINTTYYTANTVV